MEHLNKTPTTGKFGDVAKVLDTNFGLIVMKLMELSEAKKMNCGFYSSETELKTAYPNPDKGMMAYVGSGTDYTVYRCKTDGTWTATSETFKVTVDLSTYATKDALAQVKGSVDSLLLGAVYGGIASRTTNPGTPKTKVFYLPTEVGEYPNFGYLSVVENEIAFLYYDGTNWTKQSVDFSNNFNDINDKLSNLSDELVRSTSEIVRSEISIEETVENQYMLSTKTIKDDSIYKAYSMDYYPVEPNKFFRIIGTAKGIDVATIALLANKEATEAQSVYDVSKSLDDIVNADRVLFIPEGVSYVAVSRNKTYTSKCYVVGEGENRFDVLENSKANKTDVTESLAKKFDNNKIFNNFGAREDGVLNQRLVSFYLNDLYFRKTLLNAESTEAAYFDDKLVKISDRFNAYDLNFYKVEEGQSICVKGSSSGKIVAIALLSDKDNLKAIKGYGFPSDDNIVDANAVIVIPSGITYIALSKRKTRDLDAYLIGKDVRIHDLEISKANKSDVQSSVSELKAKNTSQDAEIAKKFDNKLYGKTLLMIGDSVTAQGFIQNRIGEILGMNIRTHAKGGIGIIQMVDGDGSGDAPEGYDPDNFGTDKIYRLNETDVKDVSIIIVFGFYNERTAIRTLPGEAGDMYPTQNTFIGRLNYAIKRIYEELNKAKNTDCRIIICTAHRFGHYPYSSYSSYDDGDNMCKYTLETANYNSLPCIDVMHNGGINEYNWNLFQKSSTDYNENYLPSDNVKDATNKPWASLGIAPAAATNKGKLITVGTTSNYTTYKSDGTNWVKDVSVYPWYGDHLHLNSDGGKLLGNYIAAQLLSL